MTEIPPKGAAPDGRRLRALAFAGGGFDTAMQLGVVHALLVASGAAPDYVGGISAGAVNAAALAEILQAGQGLSADDRRAVRVDRLRRFLNSYQELPADLLRSILPDAYEINARRPLLPPKLPIHFGAERRARDGANQSRAGLIRLSNRLLEVRLQVSTLAGIINRVLRLVAASEETSWRKRVGTRVWNLWLLWLTGCRHMVAIGPTFWSLVRAAVLHEPARNKPPGRTAGDLISFYESIKRRLAWALRLLGVICFAVVWTLIVPPVGFCVFLGLYLRRPASKRGTFWRSCLDRILTHYSIGDGLADSYVLKEHLIRCFDPSYYGKPAIDSIVDKALAYSHEPSEASATPKRLGAYRKAEPAIWVAPIAADVATGELRVLPEDVSVVEALLAATAVVPIFPAVAVASRMFRPGATTERLFIDGVNVSNEPIRALVELLREDSALDAAAVVDVYAVSDLQSDSGANGTREEYSRIIEVAARALQLRRLRDAAIEQHLTGLYSRCLPSGKARVQIEGRHYVRANILPLGLERPVAVNREIFTGQSNLDLKTLMLEAVADGCRAALEAMIPRAISTVAKGLPSVPCRQAVEWRLGDGAKLPGSSDLFGPGLAEICSHCALARGRKGAGADSSQRLLARQERGSWPEWPLEGNGKDAAPVPVLSRRSRTADGPPLPAPLPADSRPRVSLLFGGGVFRGVFHMGVMNALHELGLEPDLVAGSSVGSIIAAMIAQAFIQPGPERPVQIANLAATFLGIDQLVMTDRLADFVRGVTLRAADAHFSIRDLDLVLRRFDYDSRRGFDVRLRRVAAGLERLFYLSPLDFFELVKAARAGNSSQFRALFQSAFQRFLDRGSVGQEILGTEPLALLIREQVIHRLAPDTSDLAFDSFNSSAEKFGVKSVRFLATATNLSEGKLKILGCPGASAETSLLYGLLASSAFPAVFRPRAAWEIFRSATEMDQYIDGGTMDNLPIDAVADSLYRAAQRGEIARRPMVGGQEVPHLIFTASLEVDKVGLPNQDVEVMRKSFLRLRQRARTFGYNRKIDVYADVQRDLRAIHRFQASSAHTCSGWKPLDLHVLAVRPRWLCNTFGFHPMLGFRRPKQAESIAHGCASTLATFFHENAAHPEWMRAWGVSRIGEVDESAVTSRDQRGPALNPRREGKKEGDCWFRNAPCPFSRAILKDNAALADRTPLVDSLNAIYLACGKPETHRPPHAVQEAEQ